ncbi:yeti [Musca autumnalis]|uniref:yeti n=1 Tax=Musca autumnalis TaxID=221902 RepID=UPI003CF20D91
MEKDKDYASDSDESDEDFRPDAGGESVSEEESNGQDSVEEDNETAADESKSKAKNVRSKKLTKTKSKRKNAKKDDNSDDDDDDESENYDTNQSSRRCTRQTDGDLTNGKKVIEKDTLESDEEDKSRTSALWADFLKDVNPVAAKTTQTNGSTTTVEKASSSNATNKDQTKSNNNSKGGDDDKSKETINTPSTKEEPPKKKITVTEILDFAGEEVRIQKEVDASSIKENKAAVTSAPKMQPFGRIMPGAGIKRPAGPGTSGGIGSLLNQIGKKKKLSVLEKSQMDWKSYKTEEGIEEELQTFNKGKDGYLERQDFLQRTDLRQFEIEKSLRQSSRRPL